MKSIFLGTLVLVMIFLSACSNKSISPKQRSSLDKISDFTVYIDREDRLKFLCFSNEKLENYKEATCNYYDENLIADEEVIGMSNEGFKPLYRDDSIKCGHGNILGLYVPLGAENKWNHNTDECKYRYTKVLSAHAIDRVLMMPLTFGTSVFLMGNMHTRTFDEESFTRSIKKSGLNLYYEKIYEAIDGYAIDGGFYNAPKI